MNADRRRAPWVVCAALVAAIPVLGATTVGAAPTATPSSHQSIASRAAPFLPLTARDRAAAVRQSFKRGGLARVSSRGTSDARGSTLLGQAGPARSAATHGQAAQRITSTAGTLTALAGTAQASTIHSFGTDQEITPPDENIAAGPTTLVEVVNSAVSILSRSGTVLAAADLNNFMNVTPGYSVSDPRVIYDASGGRFWMTVTEVPNSRCPAAAPVLIAVSASSNPLPLTSWLVYALPTGTNTPGTLFGDQPGLGIATNTVAVAFNDYGCSLNFLGGEVDILQKTDLEHATGSSSDYYFYGGPFAGQPVQSLGSISAQYVVTNVSDCGAVVCPSPPGPAVRVDIFTGTPEGVGGVTEQPSVFPPMTPTAVNNTTNSTPPADQPGGPQLQTDDDRFLNAVWQNGKIWAAGGTSCQPTGDTVQRSCLDYVEIGADSTGHVSATLTSQINNVGVNGAALFYPAVSVDAAGNLFTVFNESSTSMFASIMAATIPAGGSTLSSFQTLHISSTSYNAGPCTSGCRWGDYAGAAQDPVNPKDVWVVSGSSDGVVLGPCGTQNCWNTRINELTLASPTITSLTPASGPVAGGQTVTANGLDFGTDTTAAFNGLAIAITNITPQSFTFTTPASATTAGGTVQVQATDALGSSALNAASLYTYTGLANYVPLSPFRILDTRPTALGPGAVKTLQVTGVGITPVPSTATAVVVNVTEINDSTASLLTVYPFNTSRPNASNLNFLAHTVIANLVTVTLGSGGKINIYNALGSVNVAVDVEGYFAPQPATDVIGLFHPVSPVRVCDTRPQSPTPTCSAHGALGPGALMVVNFAATGGLPGDGTAGAVVVNLTGVAGTASTYLSLFPTNPNGTCTPTGTSNINLQPGAVQANRVMVALGPSATAGVNDALCVYNPAGTINVLIDANGWYGSSTTPASPVGYQYQAVAPTRICDTRLGSTPCTQGAIGAAVSRLTPVAGAVGIPAAGSATTVVAVIANLTAVVPTAATYLMLYPANLTSRPQASDLNVNAGVTLPNLVVVQLDTIVGPNDGKVYLYNGAGSVNAIIDIEGWFQ
jgi:hypothetical protein